MFDLHELVNNHFTVRKKKQTNTLSALASQVTAGNRQAWHHFRKTRAILLTAQVRSEDLWLRVSFDRTAVCGCE